MTIDNIPVEVQQNGSFSWTFLLDDGSHAFTVEAVDSAGNSNSTSFTVIVDTVAPSLTVTKPIDGTQVGSATVEVTGMTEAGARVLVNERPIEVAPDGSFATILELNQGRNDLTLTSSDAAGNIATRHISLFYASDQGPPGTPALGPQSVPELILVVLPWLIGALAFSTLAWLVVRRKRSR